MRIALFDWTVGGHHALYLRRAAESMSRWADVIIGAPERAMQQLVGAPASLVPLDDERPPTNFDAPIADQNRRHAEAEIDRFERFASEARPDHLVHMYADPVIRRLVARPPLPAPTTLLIFFPRAHYPRRYGSPLTARERLSALFLEVNVARWRRRPDAHAVMTLDEVAAAIWRRRLGAPAYWFPEPPVRAADLPTEPSARRGVVLYGSLAGRKGIDRLSDAVVASGGALDVTLAGSVEPGYEEQLSSEVARMRAAGASIDLRGWRHDEREGLAVLAGGRCAVLPYPRHNGMSRVLLEAAAVGTPVVAHAHGLVADLVRRHGIGVVVDCGDPRALNGALGRLSAGDGGPAVRIEALRAFCDEYGQTTFDEAVSAPFAAEAASGATAGGRRA